MSNQGSDERYMQNETGAGEYATDAEVRTAIDHLSDVDLMRLDWVARFRSRMMNGRGGIESNDLLQEAIMRTLTGERRWRRKVVSFVKHLCETMRSIASHACERLHGATVESGTVDDADPSVTVMARQPDLHERVASREQLERTVAMFDDDEEVLDVLAGLWDGKKGPDIQRDLGISATQYATIMTRLRRGVRRGSGGR